MAKDNMQYVVDMLLEGDEEGAEEFLLLESEAEDIVRSMGSEVSLLNYALKLEEYLDDHDLYLFQGWDEAELVQPPKVEKFWVTFWLRTAPNTDMRGIYRIVNDKEAQNQIDVKKLDQGYSLVQLKILKRYLDQIEVANKEKADQMADDKLEEY